MTRSSTPSGRGGERTEPAPDPYLVACRALGVDPAGCVAVEDRTGVTSAEAAAAASSELRGPGGSCRAVAHTVIAQSQSRRLKMTYKLVQTIAIRAIAKGYPKLQRNSGMCSKFIP